MVDTWTKKYAPKKGVEVVGQDKAIIALKTFVVNFKNAKRRGLILYGPPGCGKTSSVYAIATELAKDIIEVNASDCRNKEAIDAVVGSASKQTSLFFRGKIILVDELDGVSGMNDRGGVAAIADIVKTTSFPIVITANNPFDEKFSSLRKVCDSAEFVEMDSNNAFLILRKIADAEKLKCEDSDLKSLARRSGGDLRGAITDLQILTTVGGVFDKNALDDLEGRKQTESMPTALTKVLKTTDPKIALTAFENVDEDMDEQTMWVDYNLGMEYTKAEDLYRAYTSLAKADIFNHRIRRWQHWRYLVYVSALMTAGVAVAKDEKYKFVGYRPTSRILKIWGANMRNAKKKAIAEKIAEATHTSKKVVIRDVMPYLQVWYPKEPLLRSQFNQEFDITPDEEIWLRKGVDIVYLENKAKQSMKEGKLGFE